MRPRLFAFPYSFIPAAKVLRMSRMFNEGIIVFCLSLLIDSSLTQTDDQENQEVYGVSTTEIPRTLRPGVTEVFFVGSRIGTIPSGAFAGNTELEKVEFMATNTTTIELGGFDGLIKLRSVEISNNPLSCPVSVFPAALQSCKDKPTDGWMDRWMFRLDKN
ncbi:hypothetical protein CRENBAI_020714 [Crenichthys baileyi]|uniref:Uncharacterized protein n=1 Tax=Crenichthys baileyi TaxID=28760 RepID=A0AAV9RIM3_9TELE